MKKHNVLKVGTAVRLHGYCAARVESFEYEDTHPYHEGRGTWYAHCRVTARRKVGPHGYRPGETVTVRVHDAVPRDLIRIARGIGKLCWPTFTIEVQP